VIKLDNITYQYPQGTIPVIHGFTDSFQQGMITAVSGKNGCGKTTLTKILAGVLRPSEGSVTIDGNDTAYMNLFEIGQCIGYVFQNPNRQLFCDTVFNEIAYGLINLGMTADQVEREVSFFLKLFGLTQYRETYPGKLSLGEKQRLALAAVIALGTDYLVLDEPTTGLDMLRQSELGNILTKLKQEKNLGIVIATHSSDFIMRYADRELVM